MGGRAGVVGVSEMLFAPVTLGWVSLEIQYGSDKDTGEDNEAEFVKLRM